MAVSQQTPLRTFRPRWPARAEVNPDRVAFAYDRLSDTLYVDFDGVAKPAVSVQITTAADDVDVYLRVDPVTEDVVGLQIEGVLDGGESSNWLRNALSLADLRGVSTIEDGGLPDPAVIDRGAVVAAFFDLEQGN